jgi:uncharacterized protein (TIGR01777 family)
MTMRVMITGGTGLIGHALAMSLGNDGHEVIILSRNPQQAGPMPETVKFEQWDAETAHGWGHLTDGADAIVNLASANLAGDHFLPTRWSQDRKRILTKSRINSGKAVVAAVEAAKKKPGVVIQSSASGYYGVHPMDVEITEEAPGGDDFLANLCKKWEASTEAVEAQGVRRAIIRSALILDAKEGALPRMALPFKLFVGGPFGNGKQPVPWIHLEDEVRAIRFLIENSSAKGAFNLVAPEAVTNAQFSKALGKALNRPSYFPTPGFAFKLAFGEVSMVILEGQKFVPKKLLDMGFTFKHPHVEEALRDVFN